MAFILVAEDDRVSSQLICSLIHKMGHRTLRCRDGGTAWKVLEDNADLFDVLVTDLMMPEMSGEELLQRVRGSEELKRIPVIVQSAYLGVRGTLKIVDKGADAVLNKPIDAQLLRDYIRRCVGKPSTKSEASLAEMAVPPPSNA